MSGIYCKSCEKMDEVENNSVDLIVTSPPYWNAIDYDQHVADRTKNYRTRNGDDYKTYLNWLERCFGEVYRKTKPGKYCAVVIGTVLYNHFHYPLPYHFVSLMEKIGFEFHQDIIWHKVTGGVKRAGVTIQNPHPGYYYPNIMTEYILIFRKPGGRDDKRSIIEKKENRILIDDLFVKELANNIWHIAPVPPNQYDHPCPFPEEIPYRLIMLYTYKGERVLDPFLGIGTTTKVAKALGREYFGYDIKKKYIDIAQKRLNERLKLRNQLITEFKKIPIEAFGEGVERLKLFVEKPKVEAIAIPL